jgi:hypothetical protein
MLTSETRWSLIIFSRKSLTNTQGMSANYTSIGAKKDSHKQEVGLTWS